MGVRPVGRVETGRGRAKAAANPNGATSTNTHRQLAALTTAPPTSGPTAVEIAEPAAHAPIADPACPSSPPLLLPNVCSIRAREFGTNKDPAIPCSSRSDASTMTFGAREQSAEA